MALTPRNYSDGFGYTRLKIGREEHQGKKYLMSAVKLGILAIMAAKLGASYVSALILKNGLPKLSCENVDGTIAKA